MRIIHLATTLSGGAGIGLWRYHRALRTQGVDSRILVMDPPPGTEAEIGKVVWRKHPLPFRLAHRLGLVRTTQERLRTRIAELDRRAGNASYELFSLPCSDYCAEDHPWLREAEVVNLHWIAGLLDWPRFFHRVHQPLVVTLHDQYAYQGGFHYALDARNNPQLAEIEAEMRQAKQRAMQGHRVAVMANSRWNENEARASGFFPEGTAIESIYYPLDTSIYRPADALSAKATLGLDPAIQVVGFACENLNNRRKGFADLVDALTLLPEKLRGSIALVSFGRHPDSDLRARLALPWRHLGYLDTDESKIAAYTAMDVFVAPSRAEAFGLAAIEAQACGIPVLANPVGGLREAVSFSTEDFSADSFAPATLTQALAALLSSPEQRAARAARGRAEIVARHDPVRTGQQLTEFHRRLLPSAEKNLPC